MRAVAIDQALKFGGNLSLVIIALAALASSMEELKVAPPAAKEVIIIDEPTVDENTIMKAYEALIAEDPR